MRKLRCLSITLVLLIVFVVSCTKEGPEGPMGAQGPQGVPGNQWANRWYGYSRHRWGHKVLRELLMSFIPVGYHHLLHLVQQDGLIQL